MFYFDNISFLTHLLNQLFINQSCILPHNGFNNLFSTVQETNHFMEVRWLKRMLIGHAKLNISTANLKTQASFSYMNLLGIASHLSWFQCLSCICIVKLTFNTSTQSSSKWPIYSYIPINKDHWYQCSAKPCQFQLQFWLNSMSSPLNIFSDITPKCFCLKKDSFGNTVIIKVQKQYMRRLGHERHYMLHPVQPICYVPLVLYHC